MILNFKLFFSVLIFFKSLKSSEWAEEQFLFKKVFTTLSKFYIHLTPCPRLFGHFKNFVRGKIAHVVKA